MSGRSEGAFTLMEMLLALAVTVGVSLAVVMVLGGVGKATEVQADHRRAMVKRQVAAARLGSLTRSAAMVLAAGDDLLVLWSGDVTANGQPDVSELRVLRFDEPAGEIWVHEAAGRAGAGADTAYALSEDFSAVAADLVASGRLAGSVVFRGVLSWEVEPGVTPPGSARLVRLRLTVRSEGGPDEAVVITALRASP